MTTVATLQAVFTADTTSFDTGARNVQTKMQQMGTSVQNIGRNVGDFGRHMAVLTVPLAAVFGASIKAAMDFESAFAGVVKTVDASDAELQALRDTIRQMATDKDNPLSGMENAHETLAKIMELGGQLGVELKDLPKFTQVIGELSITTNLTAEAAATMIAQFANITGLDMKDVDRLGSVIVALGNNMATTESEILEMGQRLAGIGATIGLTEPQILALSGTMSSLGINAEAGGSSMSRILSKMIESVGQGGTALDNFAAVSGMTASDFKTTWEADPMEALQAFLTGLGDLDEAAQVKALDDLGLDGVIVAMVLRAMSGNTELLTDALTIANTAWAENNALTEEARKRAETAESKWNLFKNTLNDLKIVIGDVLLPVLTDLLEDVGAIVIKVGEWVGAHPELAKWIGIVTITLAGLSLGLMVLGPVITALGAIIAFGGTALTVALGLLLSPIALVIGAGVALGVGLFMLKDKFVDIANAIREVVIVAFENIKIKIDEVIGKIKGAVEDVRNAVNDVTGFVGGIDNTIGDFLGIGGGGGSDFEADVQFGSVSDLRAGISAIQSMVEPRAVGGPVTAGMPYIVGERGPELFVPSSSGAIMPNSSMGGGGGRTIVIHQLDVHGVQDVEGLFDQLQRVQNHRAG